MKRRWYVVHAVVSVLLILFLIGLQSGKKKEQKTAAVKKPAPAAAPVAAPAKPAPADPFAPETMAAVGEQVIFGPSRPKFDPARGVQIGRGQCPACHVLLEEQQPNRFPRLIGVVARAEKRIQEDRYKMFMKLRADGEENTGIKTHAKTSGEYLIESIYCPNCYVVDEPGVLENERMVSPMPVINRMGVGLSDYEMASIAAYFQSVEAQGDFTKVTAKQDWENYFGKKLTEASVQEAKTPTPTSPQDLARIGLTQESTDDVIKKMGCYLCHKIPTVGFAQTGMIGPMLAMKTTAEKRIASPEYQQLLKEGKVRATTPKQYVMESIMNPGAFIAPGFDDAMPKDFKTRMTFGAVEHLAEFLLTLDEQAAGNPAGKEGAPSPAPTGKPAKFRD